PGRKRSSINDAIEAENEIRQERFAGDVSRVIKDFDWSVGPINVYPVPERINQSAEPRAVSQVFFHLLLQRPEPVCLRAQFHHKVRADVGEFITLLWRQRFPSLLPHPRDI